MADSRPLTAAERDLLAAHAVDPRSFASFLAVSWGMGVATLFVAFLVLAVPLTLAGVDFGAKPAQELVLFGVAVVFAFWTAIALRNFRRHRARRAPLEAALRDDLAGGIARVERHRASAIIRVTRAEHGERAYFVQLVDGRVLFVGYWTPSETDRPDTREVGGFPSADFEIARGPSSALVLGVAGRGAPLAPEDAFELGHRADERLPAVGDWVSTPWNEIRARYG